MISKELEGNEEKDKIAKFTGSLESDVALEKMVIAVNDGHIGGKVTKQDLLSWILIRAERDCFKDWLEDIRADNFDQLAYLENVLREAKRARKEGLTPIDLAQSLSILNRTNTSGKRPKRGLAVDTL